MEQASAASTGSQQKCESQAVSQVRADPAEACRASLLHLFGKIKKAAAVMQALQCDPCCVTADRADEWCAELTSIAALFSQEATSELAGRLEAETFKAFQGAFWIAAFEAKRLADALRQTTQVIDYDAEGSDVEIDACFPIPSLANNQELPTWPFRLGVILGPSGSGKTLWLEFLRKHYNLPRREQEDLEHIIGKAIVSHEGLGDDRVGRLQSIGLNDVPAWTRPFEVLSTGQQARFKLALKLGSQMAIDDFGSTLDYTTACSAAASIARMVRRGPCEGVLVATTREEVVPWLSPDFVLFTATNKIYMRPGIDHVPPTISLKPSFGSFVSAEQATDGRHCGWNSRKQDPLDPGPKREAAGLIWQPIDGASRLTSEKILEEKVLQCTVQIDEHVSQVTKAFEYDFTGECETRIPKLSTEKLSPNFNVGVIVGPSGSGKSTILKDLWPDSMGQITWPPEASIATTIVAAMGDHTRGLSLLDALRLDRNCYFRQRPSLSNSEGLRADAALAIAYGFKMSRPIVIDEFTSELDRRTAECACRGVRNWLHRNQPLDSTCPVVFATVHDDVVGWLQPDWAFHTETRYLVTCKARELLTGPGGPLPAASSTLAASAADPHKWFSVPEVKLEILSLRHLPYQKTVELWKRFFSKHHYLRGDLQSCAVCMIVREAHTRAPVAFYASIPAPGTVSAAWREHRLVVRPEWQGLSIGPRLSNLMASRFHINGMHYFSTTAHPRLATCRQVADSPWRPTAGAGADGKKGSNGTWGTFAATRGPGQRPANSRLVFSHRYHGYCNWVYSNTEAPGKCVDPRCLTEAGLEKPECEALLIVKRERVEARNEAQLQNKREKIEAKIEAQAQQVHDALQAQIAQRGRQLSAKALAKSETQSRAKMQSNKRTQPQEKSKAPVKRTRYPEEQKTWVCPYPGCGHRMNPSSFNGFSAGQVFHVANHHRRTAFGTCSCGHGCPACVPHLMRDATGNKFRLAVAEANGTQLGELLQSGDGFPEDLSKSHLSMREAFLAHAITNMTPEIRQSFCQAALAIDKSGCKLSTAAQRIKEVLVKVRDGKFQAASPARDDE